MNLNSTLNIALSCLVGLLLCTSPQQAEAQTSPDNSDGWISLMDGKTFNGWKRSAENPESWQIVDGAFVTSGPRSHLYYDGPKLPFTNFELKADVRTTSGSNGGIYFASKYQPRGWPKVGYEIQVNQTHSDWKKSGSIYDVANVRTSPVKDDEWYTYDITVKDKRITVKINGQVVNDWTEEPERKPGKDFTRIIAPGTIALQGHDPKSHVEYKNIKIRKLD